MEASKLHSVRAGTERHHRRAIERVIEVMHQRLDEELTLEAMADVAIMSPFHLNRVFRQLTGVGGRQSGIARIGGQLDHGFRVAGCVGRRDERRRNGVVRERVIGDWRVRRAAGARARGDDEH